MRQETIIIGKGDLAELTETAEMAETQEFLSGRASTTLAL